MTWLVVALIVFLPFSGCSPARERIDSPSTSLEGQTIRSTSLATSESLLAAVDSVVQESMERDHLPGVAVIVVQDGRTLIQRGYGVANIETGAPVDPERTLFRIGSITKTLTSLALTRLIDEGRLDYDTPVLEYFPDLSTIRNVSGTRSPVLVQHLLTHTAGFDQIGGPDRHVLPLETPRAIRIQQRPDIRDWLFADRLRQVTPPGQMFRYDTYGITLAGALIEEVTGEEFAHALDMLVFEPLGMASSGVDAGLFAGENAAVGYGFIGDRFEPQPFEVYVTTPASSVDATPADMARLLEALTGGGANDSGRFLSAEMIDRVLAPQYRPHPDFTGISHGLWEYHTITFSLDEGLRGLQHGGSMQGFHSALTLIPQAGIGVFVATNRDAEAGGGSINLNLPVLRAVTEQLAQGDPVRFPEPVSSPMRSLAEYEGAYVNSVYCHTCTQTEFEAGAWRRPDARPVVAAGDLLIIGGQNYLPTAETDVFVHESGIGAVYFGRGMTGSVESLVYHYGPAALERISDSPAPPG